MYPGKFENLIKGLFIEVWQDEGRAQVIMWYLELVTGLKG